jgi:hypothetical protein
MPTAYNIYEILDFIDKNLGLNNLRIRNWCLISEIINEKLRSFNLIKEKDSVVLIQNFNAPCEFGIRDKKKIERFYFISNSYSIRREEYK